MELKELYAAMDDLMQKVKKSEPQLSDIYDSALCVLVTDNQHIYGGISGVVINNGNIARTHPEYQAITAMLVSGETCVEKMLTMDFKAKNVISPCQECINLLCRVNRNNLKTVICTSATTTALTEELAKNLKGTGNNAGGVVFPQDNMSVDSVSNDTFDGFDVPDEMPDGSIIDNLHVDESNPFYEPPIDKNLNAQQPQAVQPNYMYSQPNDVLQNQQPYMNNNPAYPNQMQQPNMQHYPGMPNMQQPGGYPQQMQQQMNPQYNQPYNQQQGGQFNNPNYYQQNPQQPNQQYNPQYNPQYNNQQYNPQFNNGQQNPQMQPNNQYGQQNPQMQPTGYLGQQPAPAYHQNNNSVLSQSYRTAAPSGGTSSVFKKRLSSYMNDNVAPGLPTGQENGDAQVLSKEDMMKQAREKKKMAKVDADFKKKMKKLGF